jgi:hypothetical protein
MARTLGGIGLVKREFEADFYKWCDKNNFSPGEACADLMKRAVDRGDARTYVQLAAVMIKAAGETPAIDQAQPELLVVDRTRAAG